MHFAYPFAFNQTTGHVKEVDQDTIEDVIGCIEVAILTDYGFRPEVPTFGVPDQVFELQPLNLDTIIQAIESFEPRASMIMTQSPDAKDPLIDHITNVVALRSTT